MSCLFKPDPSACAHSGAAQATEKARATPYVPQKEKEKETRDEERHSSRNSAYAGPLISGGWRHLSHGRSKTGVGRAAGTWKATVAPRRTPENGGRAPDMPTAWGLMRRRRKDFITNDPDSTGRTQLPVCYIRHQNFGGIFNSRQKDSIVIS